LEDAAWQLTVANAIFDRYPAPLPSDLLPSSLDREPVPVRLVELRCKVGPSAMDDDVRRAAATFRHWGYGDVAALLDTWTGA
jgi:hypothetical protein